MMGALRDYRIESGPDINGHKITLYEGAKVKDHFLVKTFELAIKYGKKWVSGQSN